MSLSGIISSDLLNMYREGQDEMYRGLAVPCRLEYIPVRSNCSNCILDTMTSRSSGKYKTGGPYPFSAGNCPFCNGVGFIESATTESVNFQVGWKAKEFIDFFKTAAVLQSPNSYVQIKAALSDVPKLKKARLVVINTPWEASIRYNFQVDSEPIPCGITQDKYIFMLLKRV